jgi:hypothetical protein
MGEILSFDNGITLDRTVVMGRRLLPTWSFITDSVFDLSRKSINSLVMGCGTKINRNVIGGTTQDDRRVLRL